LGCNTNYEGISGNYSINLKILLSQNADFKLQKKCIFIISKRLKQYGFYESDYSFNSKGDTLILNCKKVDFPDRVVSLILSEGNLEFWETYNFQFLMDEFKEANELTFTILNSSTLKKKKSITKSGELEVESETNSSLFKFLNLNNIMVDGNLESAKSPVIGYSLIEDTAKVMEMLNLPEVKNLFPQNCVFIWGIKPTKNSNDKKYLELFAIKVSSSDGEPLLNGEVITDALQDFGQDGQVEVNITMNSIGAKKWQTITSENINDNIAIVMDNHVYSAPKVITEILGGKSQISGGFTIEEAKDLAAILKSMRLPCKLTLIEKKFTNKVSF
jgi:SecD/SecF fusion protein